MKRYWISVIPAMADLTQCELKHSEKGQNASSYFVYLEISTVKLKTRILPSHADVCSTEQL